MFLNYRKNAYDNKQCLNSSAHFDELPHLHLSYDLDNYHSLLTEITTNEDPRWILFIAPPGKPNFSFLQQAGIDKSRIITLAQSQINDPAELLKTALASNNYATVITWVKQCSKAFQEEINQLAEKSASRCFVYCAQ